MGDKAIPLLIAGAATVATAGAAAPALFGAAGAGATAGLSTGATALASTGSLLAMPTASAGLFTAGNIFTGISALGSLAAGVTGYASAKDQKAQLAQQAQYEQVRAGQEEANRQSRLVSILNDQMAMTAGRGIQVGTGSDLALAEFSSRESAREGRIAGYDSAFKTKQIQGEAKQAGKAGYSSLISGLSDAGTKVYGGYTRNKERLRTT